MNDITGVASSMGRLSDVMGKGVNTIETFTWLLPLVIIIGIAVANIWIGKKPKEEKMEDEEKTLCSRCDKDITNEDENDCGECDETFCDDCMVFFSNADNVCKNCVDEAYPREKEIQKEYVEKIVEVEVKHEDITPIYKTDKNKFKENKWE
jgi:hypothetical protein